MEDKQLAKLLISEISLDQKYIKKIKKIQLTYLLIKIKLIIKI